MSRLTTWMKLHSETISILLLIFFALLAGIAAGFVLIVIANLIGLL